MIRRNGKLYTLDVEQWLPRPLDEIFPFYGDATNLERLTPPWLKFNVLTPEIEMRPGALIDYRLKVRGLPIRWRTEITEWEPPFRFRDQQLKGPYRVWDHTHTFEEKDGGTLVRDHVDFLAPGGALVHKLLVNRDVKTIFAYRQQRLEEIFGE